VVAFAWQAVMQICCASSVAQFSSKLETRLPQRRDGASNKGQAQQQQKTTTFGAGTTKIPPADEDEDWNEDSATDDQLSRHFLPVRPPK